MIYVIRTKYSSCTLLKIGYTGDDNFDTRMSQYKMHNPLYEVIYKIPEGDEEDEKSLHWLFRKYLYQGSKEWFYEDQTIYDFFKTHTTKESLVGLEQKPKRVINQLQKDRNRLLRELKIRYINKVLSNTPDTSTYPDIIDKLTRKINELLITCFDSDKVDNYFKLTYPDIDFNKVKVTVLDQSIAETIKEIENIRWFEDKMKYVYNLNLSPDQMKTILDNVSNTDLSKYYYSIPASRAGSLNYRKTALEQEYTNQKKSAISFPQVEKEILERFLPGFKYSNVLIKEELKRIYSNNKYSKTPKASNLNEVFTVRKCKVQNSSGAWENGLEILSVK